VAGGAGLLSLVSGGLGPSLAIHGAGCSSSFMGGVAGHSLFFVGGGAGRSVVVVDPRCFSCAVVRGPHHCLGGPFVIRG